MKHFALLESGDKVALTEEEFAKLKLRMLRSIAKNIELDNGGLIASRAIIYLGIEGTAKKAK